MVAKKWKAMFVGIKFVIPDPLSLPPLQLKKCYLRQLTNNQNQMHTTVAQNLKEFTNVAGWLSVFCNGLIKYSQHQTTPSPSITNLKIKKTIAVIW
jgi:hypothetical protein